MFSCRVDFEGGTRRSTKGGASSCRALTSKARSLANPVRARIPNGRGATNACTTDPSNSTSIGSKHFFPIGCLFSMLFSPKFKRLKPLRFSNRSPTLYPIQIADRNPSPNFLPVASPRRRPRAFRSLSVRSSSMAFAPLPPAWRSTPIGRVTTPSAQPVLHE